MLKRAWGCSGPVTQLGGGPRFRSACSAHSAGSPVAVPCWGHPTNGAEVLQGLLNSGTVPAATSHWALQDPGRFKAFSVPLLFFPIWILQERRKRTGSHPWAGAPSPSMVGNA